MKRFTIFLTVALLFATTVAQSQTLIAGKVVDQKQTGLPYATITLMQAKDSAVVKTTLSDSLGVFAFANVPASVYFISASMTGFVHASTAPVQVGSIATIQIPVMVLSQSKSALATVTVTARRSFIERKIDRTVMNVENSAIAAGSTVLEVLEKAPGVLVDKDGNISMSGKAGVMVMIDGKQTYMSSSDLAQLLRTMQSSLVETIELITNPSAKYDAAGNAGIINIKTKKTKTVGTNGSVNVASGYGDNFKGNAGINLNHRTEKLNLFGNYNYGSNYSYRILEINRVNNSANVNTYFNQHLLEKKHYQNNNFKAGVDFFINPKNTFGFLVTGYQNTTNTNSGNITRIGATEMVADSLINAKGDNHGKYNDLSYNVNYRVQLGSEGQELTVDADYSDHHSVDVTGFENLFFKQDGSPLKSAYINRNSTPSAINIKSVKADYILPLAKTMKLEAGVKTSIVRTDNDLQFEELENNEWKNNTNRSNRFVYDESVYGAYINANRQFKNTSVQVGVRAENTISVGNSITENKVVKRSYFDLFPSLFVNHTFSANHVANFSYSRRIDRPGYESLNPFVYYVDQYTFQKGNPFLNPQYTHSFELGYTFKRKYNANFRYAKTNDNITDVILPDTARKGLYQTATNIKSANYLSLTLSAPVAIAKWWNTNNTLTIFNNDYQTNNLAGLDLRANQTSFYFNSNQTFNLPCNYTAEVSGNYTSSNVYGTLYMGNMFGIDMGLSKSLLNKKANVKLSVSDIFNTRERNIHSTLSNVNYQLYQKQESRVFRISFNYRFGSSSIKEARNHTTGLESEQSRIKR